MYQNKENIDVNIKSADKVMIKTVIKSDPKIEQRDPLKEHMCDIVNFLRKTHQQNISLTDPFQI